MDEPTLYATCAQCGAAVPEDRYEPGFVDSGGMYCSDPCEILASEDRERGRREP